MSFASTWLRLKEDPGRRKRLVLVLLASCVVPWVGFGVLAKSVWESGGFVGDKRILTFLNQHATPELNKLAIFLTNVGDTGPMVGTGVLITGALLVRRRRAEAWVF